MFNRQSSEMIFDVKHQTNRLLTKKKDYTDPISATSRKVICSRCNRRGNGQSEMIDHDGPDYKSKWELKQSE